MEWVNTPVVLGSKPSTRYILVTIAIAGLQFVWSLEQAYVNVYLLDLGMTKSTLSLMWLAGPTCGLVVQPIVGVASDFSTSRHGRRRPFMIWGALVVTLGLVVFAWAREIGARTNLNPIGVAVLGVLIVDVAVNTCQACCRALIVDMFSEKSQAAANGWASRMAAVGHLVSYYLGSVDLTKLGFESQMKAASVLCSVVLIVCVSISSAATKERVLVKGISATRKSLVSEFVLIVRRLFDVTRTLDYQLKGIFKVQLLAWYAWFTFLFYGSTYASEVWRSQLSAPPSTGEMARAGSFALAVFSMSSTFFTFVLPKVPRNIINIWTFSFIVYAFAMLITRWASTYKLVLFIFALVGFSWAAALWVPFALTSKRIHELPNPTLPEPQDPEHAPQAQAQRQAIPQAMSQALQPNTSSSRHNSSSSDSSSVVTATTLYVVNDEEAVPDCHDEQSGIIMGIHNSALTLPQFISAFGSHVIFQIMDVDPSNPHGDGGKIIAVTLQVGAFTALLAAFYSNKLKRLSD